MTLFWGVSPTTSWPHWFLTEDLRDEWVAERGGVAIDESQVDPDIVAAAKARP